MNGFARFAFVGLAFCVVLSTLWTNGDVLVLLRVPGLAFVSALVILGLFASFGPAVVRDAFLDIVRRDATERERALHARVWHRAHGLSWGSGVLATLCSLILLFANLESPDQILPSFGMCLMPLFWSAIFAELLFASFGAWSEREAAIPNPSEHALD